MSEQTARLAKLATDLLDLSRLDAGGMRIELEPVELGEVAYDLADEFAAVAAREEHPLDAVVEADGIVQADRERVLQIGRALVDNAIGHTPRGTPVRVLAGERTLTVEDEGPGIPAEHQEQVFERFTRLRGARAAGTGLGLAIARELAGRMGGELTLVSEPGRTAFVLVLPAAARIDRHEVVPAR
jgi:signal transduction histidine kinase